MPLLALILACVASAAPPAPLPPMPIALSRARAALVDGKFYVIGGGITRGSIQGAVEIYDIASNTWWRNAAIPMPTPRVDPSVAVLDGKIYVIGGELGEEIGPPHPTVVEVFDTRTRRWSSGPDLPAARRGAGAAVLGGKIYVVGGEKRPDAPLPKVGYVLDPKLGRWQELPAMPTARTLLGVASFRGRIWAVGGSAPDEGATSLVESFDPVHATWRTEAALPWEGAGDAAVAGGALYVFGGSDGTASDIDSLAVFAGDHWENLPPMPTGRSSFASATDGERIYVVGGWQGGDPLRTAALKTLEIYDTRTKTWRTSADPPVNAVAE